MSWSLVSCSALPCIRGAPAEPGLQLLPLFLSILAVHINNLPVPLLSVAHLACNRPNDLCRVVFPLSPEVTSINAGTLAGSVRLQNQLQWDCCSTVCVPAAGCRCAEPEGSTVGQNTESFQNWSQLKIFEDVFYFNASEELSSSYCLKDHCIVPNWDIIGMGMLILQDVSAVSV